MFVYLSVNIIFKIHYMLVGKYIFVIFLNLFVIKNFNTCSSVEMLKEYMAIESSGTSAPGVQGRR